MRTYTREHRALVRATKSPPPWSKGFIAFWLFGLSVILGALIAVAAHASVSRTEHHAQVRHELAVHRALRLHALKVHRAQLVRHSHGHGLTWWTAHTATWACIRRWESGSNYRAFAGAYGFSPGYWGATPHGAQDRLALHILHVSGPGAWSTAQRCGL